MSKRYIPGPIKTMKDLALEKQLLKKHIVLEQEMMMEAIEQLPASAISGFLLKNSGKAARLAGSMVLNKVLAPASKNIGTVASSALQSKTLWGSLAVNAGTFLVGEVAEFLGKKKRERQARKAQKAIEEADD